MKRWRITFGDVIVEADDAESAIKEAESMWWIEGFGEIDENGDDIDPWR